MADWDYNNTPEWYEKLKKEQGCGQNQIPHYEEITLSEFCGRFNLTPEKASWEIKSRKLWGYDRYYSHSFHGPSIPGEYHLPEPEADRYAAILEAEKLATTQPIKHPCLDSELEFHSKRLALALEAWEYAVSQKSIKKNFMQRIESYLKKHNVSDSDTARIKEICNPWPRGPKSSNKL